METVSFISSSGRSPRSACLRSRQIWGPKISTSVETNCSPPKVLIVSVCARRISWSCLTTFFAMGRSRARIKNAGRRVRKTARVYILVSNFEIGVNTLVITTWFVPNRYSTCATEGNKNRSMCSRMAPGGASRRAIKPWGRGSPS